MRKKTGMNLIDEVKSYAGKVNDDFCLKTQASTNLTDFLCAFLGRISCEDLIKLRGIIAEHGGNEFMAKLQIAQIINAGLEQDSSFVETDGAPPINYLGLFIGSLVALNLKLDAFPEVKP